MTVATEIDKANEGTRMSPLDSLSQKLAAEMQAVDSILSDQLNASAPVIPQVAAHLIAAGGKRVRPLLTLAAAKMCGYAGNDHIKLAAAVELIHTATLLHDDVVDGSDLRRGRDTANRLWGNKPTILVGDFLFSRSFQLMVETGSIDVLRCLSDASAIIAEGEVLQLATARNLATTEEQHLAVIRAKTAALFAAATEAGGMVAGANADETAALKRYGDCLGIAFQLCDDALDYAGTDTATGKNTGDDFREGKMTAPVLRAYAAARSEDETAFWQRVIARGEQQEDDFARAVALMARDGAVEGTLADARCYGEEAQTALAALPASPLLDDLSDLIDYVVRRDR